MSVGRSVEGSPSGRSHDIFDPDKKSALLLISCNEQDVVHDQSFQTSSESTFFQSFLEKKKNPKIYEVQERPNLVSSSISLLGIDCMLLVIYSSKYYFCCRNYSPSTMAVAGRDDP